MIVYTYVSQHVANAISILHAFSIRLPLNAVSIYLVRKVWQCTIKFMYILFAISIEEEEETELQQQEVVHIHRIYSKSIRAAPIDILIRESESKGSLDRPDVVHTKIMRTLKLTSRSSLTLNENNDIDVNNLDRPDVEHRKIMRTLRLTPRSSGALNENDDIDVNCSTQKSVRVKVKRSKHKRKHPHHVFVPPYPMFMPHLHASPMYTFTPTMCTYTPTLYPCFPPVHAHNSCCICK